MAQKPDRFQFAPQVVQAHERQRVQQWIGEGKTEQALDLAKEINRRLRNEESETLLFAAYDARFEWHLQRNTTDGAKALIEHVSKTYPHAADLVSKWSDALTLRQGDADTLLTALTDPAAMPEQQARAANWIRRSVTDLRGIAESSRLAPENPLRLAAAALDRAFTAVTSGPVADTDLALHEVSRQSPLSPWKMLIRAIAAFYRKDDALCEKYLGAVDPESAPARMASALRALMRGQAASNASAKALVNETGGGFETLRHALAVLDRHFEGGGKHAPILQAIRDAVSACEDADPSLLVRLRQHISIRCVRLKINPGRVADAMKGPSLKNAHFWRLLARATEEQKGSPIVFPIACSYWEEFRKHAIHEGWFRETGPEVAALYLHMDDLWHKISPDSIDRARHDYVRNYAGNRSYYDGQPPEIRALMPGKENLYFLRSYEILERACAADPCSENFRRWLHTAEDSPQLADRIAERWADALPRDIPPLIVLMESAEKRNALQKAFKYMERAEQIDGVNSEVRRARLRLLVSITIRHLRDEKQHLAERDLSQLEALPQAQQGDRPAFIAALRWVANAGAPQTIGSDPMVVMQNTFGNVTAAMALTSAVIERCGLGTLKMSTEPKDMALAASLGRACALGDDMATPVTIPDPLIERIEREISDSHFRAKAADLLALGEAAIRQNHLKLAYFAAGAGLSQGAESQARFLYLRARSLPEWEEQRCKSCLGVATELARRQRDSDLLNRIGEFRDEQLSWMDIDEERPSAAISTEQIAEVVERETKERAYPKSRPPSRNLDGRCNCPDCMAERGELPPLPPGLEEMVEALGPEAVAQALAEMIGLGGSGGGKRRRRRRRFLGPDDFPF